MARAASSRPRQDQKDNPVSRPEKRSPAAAFSLYNDSSSSDQTGISLLPGLRLATVARQTEGLLLASYAEERLVLRATAGILRYE